MRPDRSSSAGELSSSEESPGRPHWWGRRSLRVKIIAWFFVPTALLLIAVAVTNFLAYQDVTADLVIERDQDVTRLSAGQLSTSLREFTDTLEEVGRGIDLSQPPGSSRFPAVQTLGRLSVFDGGVVVLSRLGTPLAARPEGSASAFEDWSSLPVFRELLVSTRPVFSSVLRVRTEDRSLVALGVPLVGARGELFGVTCGMCTLGAPSASALHAAILAPPLAHRRSGGRHPGRHLGHPLQHGECERRRHRRRADDGQPQGQHINCAAIGHPCPIHRWQER